MHEFKLEVDVRRRLVRSGGGVLISDETWSCEV